MFQKYSIIYLHSHCPEEEFKMSTRRWTLKYGGAAVLVAMVIIATVTFTNPILFPTETTTPSFTFLVMLTDPPTVPAGTTVLNLTYADVSLHVTYPNGTTKWLSVDASGTVNLFTLINMSQTIASTTLPNNSTVDMIQFTISSVKAKVDGTVYNVTTLSNQLIISIANSQKVNQTLGVLFDFQPTLVQIQAINSTGGTVNYFVLVPSATATIVTNVRADHLKVGTIVKLEDNDKVKLIRVVQETSKKIVITNASLSVNGNVTSFSVTFKNDGNTNATISGLTLHGLFNVSSTKMQNNQNDEGHNNHKNNDNMEIEHPDTIPFKINGTSLVPVLGSEEDWHGEHDENEGNRRGLTLQPGQSVTLSFSGVIQLKPEHDEEKEKSTPQTIITPILGETYTIRLMGEGYQTFNVTATAS
jgi:hypothetical protein